jgi:hypothetical protein
MLRTIWCQYETFARKRPNPHAPDGRTGVLIWAPAVMPYRERRARPGVARAFSTGCAGQMRRTSSLLEAVIVPSGFPDHGPNMMAEMFRVIVLFGLITAAFAGESLGPARKCVRWFLDGDLATTRDDAHRSVADRVCRKDDRLCRREIGLFQCATGGGAGIDEHCDGQRGAAS